jgi:hypothetical protein
VTTQAAAGGAPRAVVCILLVLVVAAGAWRVELQRWQNAEAAHQASLADCQSATASAKDAAKSADAADQARLAQCRSEMAAGLNNFASYRQAAEGDPRQWFKAFSGDIAQRPFLARLALRWHSEFGLNDKLQGNETLLDGRQATEAKDSEQQRPRSSAGFLLGRRSNYLFGLVMVSRTDPGFAAPDWLRTPPPAAHIYVPWGVDRDPGYSLAASSVQVDVEVLAGCREGAPPSIVHAWRTKYYFALVIGCEAALGGTDMPLFPYEGFHRFIALSDQEIALPTMTPAGGVAISWVCLDRRYGEPGMGLKRIGMPSSISAAFLPVEEGGMAQPVLHSLIFHLDEGTEWWVPFWAVRTQLASAQDIFDLAGVLELPFTLTASPSTAPERRLAMLRSYQNLINNSEEHVIASGHQPEAAGAPCSTSLSPAF